MASATTGVKVDGGRYSDGLSGTNIPLEQVAVDVNGAGRAMTSVLVIDDCAADRELLATVLRDGGYTVREASAAAGVDVARAQRPDVIVADILMPGMDGYELVCALGAEPACAGVAIILCSATYDSQEVGRLAAACGVMHTIVKPGEPEEILRIVDAALAEGWSSPTLPAAEDFQREHLRLLNAKLRQQVKELEAARRQTAESLSLLETLQASAPIGIGLIDRDLRVVRINDTLAAINGRPAEEQVGRTVAEIVPPELWQQVEPLYRRVLDTGEAVINREASGVTAGRPGQTRNWLASYYPVSLGEEIIGLGVLAVDITERRVAEGFRSVVMDTMAEGLWVIDEDGHVTFMNAAASRMLGWDGDELCGAPAHATIHFQRADGSSLQEDDCEILRVRTTGEVVAVPSDAFTRKDGTILPVAYSAAPLDIASDKRGVVVVFRDISGEQAERKRIKRELDALSWVGRTRDALDDGRLILYSQPIVALRGGPPIEELLLRMIGRDGEVIPPGRFLPSAERFGLISDIDCWVAVQAIRLAASGRRVTANLSAQSIGSGELLALVEAQLRESGADPANVVFEITETGLMRDIDDGQRFAERLVELGCAIALDDFGTGFGSFTYIKRMPLMYLKIDVEFVHQLASNTANQHLVRAIVSLAQVFGQQTIAEGVDDAQTMILLREYGVDYVQGFHIGRPAPIAGFFDVGPRSRRG